MIARTHNIFAFASLITVAVFYHPEELNTITLLTSLIANSVGSMFPDIDQATNKLWDMLPMGDAVGQFVTKALLPHRSFSHSAIGIFSFGLLFSNLLPLIFNATYIDSWMVFVSFIVGYISHLMADGFTEEGLPLLYPIRYKFGFPPIKKWRIKTGKWFEKYVITPGLVIYVIWLTTSNWGLFYKLIS